jgi:hypothetical protein
MKILDKIKIIKGTNIGKAGTILHKGPNRQQEKPVGDVDGEPELLRTFWILSDDGLKFCEPEDHLEVL